MKDRLDDGSHAELSDGIDRASQSGGSKIERGIDEPRPSVGAREGTHSSAMKAEQFEKERPITWEWLAGFFDGEGTIHVEAIISQKYKPQLESTASFLGKGTPALSSDRPDQSEGLTYFHKLEIAGSLLVVLGIVVANKWFILKSTHELIVKVLLQRE